METKQMWSIVGVVLFLASGAWADSLKTLKEKANAGDTRAMASLARKLDSKDLRGKTKWLAAAVAGDNLSTGDTELKMNLRALDMLARDGYCTPEGVNKMRSKSEGADLVVCAGNAYYVKLAKLKAAASFKAKNPYSDAVDLSAINEDTKAAASLFGVAEVNFAKAFGTDALCKLLLKNNMLTISSGVDCR